MDILLDWLNKEIQLSEKVTDVETQFANGYLLCELLYSYNQILKFTTTERNDDSKSAIVRNYSLAYPIINGLKVHFDSNVALSMINRTPGEAISVLRSLKNSLEKTKGTVDFQIMKRTGQKNIVFPLKQFEPKKEKFEKVQMKLFIDRLNLILPAQKSVDLRHKLQPFEDTQHRIEAKVKEENFYQTLQAENLKVSKRQKLREDMHMGMTFKENLTVQNNKSWVSNVQIFENRKLREEKFRKSIQDKENGLKNKQRAIYVQKVYDDINTFENTFKKETSHHDYIAQFSENEYIEDLKSQKNSIAKEMLDKIVVTKIRDQMKLREKELQSDFSKKERDRRLRKLIVDLKKWQTIKELGFLKDKALKHLLKESKQEEEVRYEFFKAKAYHTIIEKNSQLYQENLKAKQSEMAEQRKSTNVHQFECVNAQLESSVQFYKGQEMLLDDQLKTKDNDRKYQRCKKVLELFINSSVDYFENKNRSIQEKDTEEAADDLFRNIVNLNKTFKNPLAIEEIQDPNFESVKYQEYLKTDFEDYSSYKSNVTRQLESERGCRSESYFGLERHRIELCRSLKQGICR
jgi:hypothetical protein